MTTSWVLFDVFRIVIFYSKINYVPGSAMWNGSLAYFSSYANLKLFTILLSF